MKRILRIFALFAVLTVCAACAGDTGVQNSISFTYLRRSEISENPMPFLEELERLTGVKLEYIYFRPGDTGEQINMLYLSDNLPDIIEYNWLNASEELKSYILPLDDLIDRYSPNLKSYLEGHPDIIRNIRSQDGYYAYPLIREEKSLNVYAGICIRSDWLEQAGLDIPETIDEWHEVLRCFRDRFGCKLPLALNSNPIAFMFAYGIGDKFYIDDGKVYFSYSRPEYKEYLSTMNIWYKEGLLGTDYPNSEYGTAERMLIDGSCGAIMGTAGRDMGGALKSGAAVAGAPYPVLNKGERPFCSQYDVVLTKASAAAISIDCDNPEAAAKFLDFGYSDEGKLLYNFGVKGVSYEIIDGRPVYTSIITDSPNMNNAMNYYLRANDSGPFLQMKEYMEQYAGQPAQQEALERWRETDAELHMLPNLHLTKEESIELSQLRFDDYIADMQIKFITGAVPLEAFDSYLEKLSELGVDRALEIYRAAYARYLAE